MRRRSPPLKSANWKARLKFGLAAIARELTPGEPSESEALFREVIRFHLLLIGASCVNCAHERPNVARHHCSETLRHWQLRCGEGAPAQWLEVRQWLSAQPTPWLVNDEVAAELPRLSREGLSNQCLQLVLGALADVFEPVDPSPGGWVTRLGDLHQLLLTTQLAALQEPAVQLKTDGPWLTARDLAERSFRGPSVPKETPLAPAGTWVIVPALTRRRAGAHYTPWALSSALVERTLEPLLAALPEPRSEGILSLRICDPAMGAGVFLVACCHYLATKLTEAWQLEDSNVHRPTDSLSLARLLVVQKVLHGVDLDPHAVSLARLALAELCSSSPVELASLAQALQCGNAVVGRPIFSSEKKPRKLNVDDVFAHEEPLHWAETFPGIFLPPQGGFDALLGNPPWISYVGRATQPLWPMVAAYHRHYSRSFQQYRTLHGLFVERCATLLRIGGRLGLLLPTSVADLDGYRPTRSAHDILCQVDTLLPDWSEAAFEGVFQPTMALLSTRRPSPQTTETLASVAPWPLKGPSVSAVEASLLRRLDQLPRCPPELFGERGYQTHPADRAEMRKVPSPEGRFQYPLQQGGDLAEFQVFEPQLHADPNRLTGRLRSTTQWNQVAVWIRQTSRFPIAALANGKGFRNSILAAFELPNYPAALLLTYLNSTLIRWYHFSRHRDARQGMPQLKIGHLRALPQFPPGCQQLETLIELGTLWGRRNCGLTSAERHTLDGTVCDAFNISELERLALDKWRTEVPTPRSRRMTSGGQALIASLSVANQSAFKSDNQ